MERPNPGVNFKDSNFFATVVEIYERKNRDELGMKFPVVGRGDFIFPAKENPVFSNKKALMEYLNHFLVTGFSKTSARFNSYLQYIALLGLEAQTSHFPWTLIDWNTPLGANVAAPIKHLEGSFYAGFGNINAEPHRKVTITKRTQDSSPLFSVTLQPKDNSHEEAANTTLGFLVVPQGSLLYFESETELSKLKSTLAADDTNPRN